LADDALDVFLDGLRGLGGEAGALGFHEFSDVAYDLVTAETEDVLPALRAGVDFPNFLGFVLVLAYACVTELAEPFDSRVWGLKVWNYPRQLPLSTSSARSNVLHKIGQCVVQRCMGLYR